jgi:hypothetical protein
MTGAFKPGATSGTTVSVEELPDTLGQSTMAGSLSVVIASDQTPIPISGSITATNPSVGLTGDPVPTSATFIGGENEFGDLYGPRVFDLDYLGPAEWNLGVNLRFGADGGSVEAGTALDPIRIDPTGTTAQPITDNGGSLTIDSSQLPPVLGSTTSANSLSVVLASDHGFVFVHDGGGSLSVDDGGGSLTVDGTVTANIGTAGGLALNTTLTNGTQKSIVRSGDKGSSVSADITSTPQSVDHEALDIQLYHSGTAIDPTQIRALTASDIVTAEVSSWLGSTAPTVGQKSMANSVPVVLASDQSTIVVSGTVTASNPSVGTNNTAAPGSSTQIGGTDGTNLQSARVFDLDSGGGTQYVIGVGLRKAASGGSVEAGTSTDPLRTDPTGTTAQPVTDNGSSITVDAPVGTPVAVRLSDGAAFYDGTKTGQLPTALVGGRLDTNIGAWLGSTTPTVGQKTMTDSLPVVLASNQSSLQVNFQSSSSSVSSVAASATSVTLLASNSSRKGASIYNDSTKNLYIKLGSTASSTSFSILLNNGGYYEVPFGYTGVIDGIWNIASGNARITELT